MPEPAADLPSAAKPQLKTRTSAVVPKMTAVRLRVSSPTALWSLHGLSMPSRSAKQTRAYESHPLRRLRQPKAPDHSKPPASGEAATVAGWVSRWTQAEAAKVRGQAPTSRSGAMVKVSPSFAEAAVAMLLEAGRRSPWDVAALPAELASGPPMRR